LQGAYMTLSHCWGNLRITTLTDDNLAGFCSKIEFSCLPKTFQDAIVTTRRVGIRYLWIDSLCIIQEGEGSKEDWVRESTTMDMIYHNSFLNIGATGAIDGRQGCFQNRDYGEIFRPVIYKPECKLHADKYLQPYRLVEPDFLEETLLKEPLLTRGWVFQERFLAPRMLHFGTKQLFWECNEMQVCETFPMHILSSTPLPALRRLTLDPANEDDEFELDLLGCYKWYQIVQEYTSKNLTRGQDKLIALSGVAQRFAALTLPENVKYWAGMWNSDMPRGLLWKTLDEQTVRPSEYRAPSWSWASMDGQIGRP
ncbi:heterokaryon incompatibility protein-domain-containing protein, partial [Phaeosphaeriaceae sp. PMI808]